MTGAQPQIGYGRPQMNIPRQGWSAPQLPSQGLGGLGGWSNPNFQAPRIPPPIYSPQVMSYTPPPPPVQAPAQPFYPSPLNETTGHSYSSWE